MLPGYCEDEGKDEKFEVFYIFFLFLKYIADSVLEEAISRKQ